MIETRVLTGGALEAAIDALAGLRIAVFRDWPYLYDGTPEYERRYLETYRNSPASVVVGAFDQGRLIGAATGTPMTDHAEGFAAAFAASSIPTDQVFYCAESVLLPEYRGRGLGHRFFDLREGHARKLGYRYAAFCSVIRPDDHPLRPEGARNHDQFWRGRGYAPMPGVIAEFEWRDLGEEADSKKPLQVWLRRI